MSKFKIYEISTVPNLLGITIIKTIQSGEHVLYSSEIDIQFNQFLRHRSIFLLGEYEWM